MPARYVILHHQTPSGEHWDFMLESGGALLTWQLMREPCGREDLPIEAQRIGDHRKAYLDYEGPISGNRGRVSRVDRGELVIQETQQNEIRFDLMGKRLTGSFRLRREGERWILDRV